MQTATITRPAPGASRLARLRSIPLRTAERVGFALLSLAFLIGFFAYPTYPNYDSYYSLLWGRELLHGQKLSFEAYRAPTEHPLAIAFGALCSLFGRGGDRLLVFATLASFVFLCYGIYRLAKHAFTPFVGAIAVALLVTRFDFPFLAARGYIDIPYLALVVWAAVLEVERPRRGLPVFLLLAAAATMRPEAWILIGVYYLWWAMKASWPDRIKYAALAAVGPVLWAAVDQAVTGDPLFSLHSTSSLAEELGRNSGLADGLKQMPYFINKTVKLPVTIAGIGGLLAALWCAPRRSLMPLLLGLSGIGTFILVGLGGLSVIPRYLVITQLLLLVFAAVGIGGWTMLMRGTWLRTAWMGAGALVVVAGLIYTATHVSIHRLTLDLEFRGAAHRDLVKVLDQPAVRAGLRCGPLSLPNHRVMPDARWILGAKESGVLSRGDAKRNARGEHGVALVITGRTALSRQVYIAGGDQPLLEVPGWLQVRKGGPSVAPLVTRPWGPGDPRLTRDNVYVPGVGRFRYVDGFRFQHAGRYYSTYEHC